MVALLGNGAGATVAMRADMDALPVAERTGLPYASTVTAETADGVVPVMHACGHDLHVAAALGAAEWFAGHREEWSGTFVLLLQPAEEVATGATSMVSAGLTGLVPTPDVCWPSMC